jgi:YHS domain-containing protein
MAVVGILMSGCSTQSSPNPASAPVAPKMSGDDGATDGLAKLSAADRAAALKQAVCPVTGAKLGSMGTPPKVVVNGQEVFLCCDGCEEKLREEPEKYLAKLKSE